MRTPTAAVVVALALPALVAAQAPAPAVPSPATAGAAAPVAPVGSDNIQAILEQETQVAPGAYTYNPQGRRDPFVSLQRPVSAEEGPRGKRPGLEGMLIQEVALKGIVRTPRGLIAMLQGTDGKSYFAQNGQKLADGVITGIDATTVTFRQDVTDPLSVVKVRELKKSLYQTEEARS
jgi:Tfp pilus assembly protein PilP